VEPIKHRFLRCDYASGKVSIANTQGVEEWRVEAKNPQDCWMLPNGNILLCNYLGHGHIGKNPHLYEVTRDKQLVWSYADHGLFKTINQVQVLPPDC
jgi:hypothetical protein